MRAKRKVPYVKKDINSDSDEYTEKYSIEYKEEVGDCMKSDIYFNKLNDLYPILFENKVGFIEVNAYPKGTQIAFYIQEYGYELENNIEVSTPGINLSIMTIGEEYKNKLKKILLKVSEEM